MYGEYWFTKDGDVVDADGDNGQDNHESVVWNYLFEEFRDALVDSKNELLLELYDLTEWGSGDPTALCEVILNLSDAWCKEGKVGEDVYDDPYSFVQGLIKWADLKWGLLLQQGSYANLDMREWAEATWGWVRYANGSMECHGLTRSRLRQIGDGLNGVAELTSSDPGCQTYEIWDYQERKFHTFVPFLAISSGDLSFKRNAVGIVGRQEAQL